MFTQILAALGLIKELLDMAKALASFIEANKNEAWFQQSNQVFTQLRNAKTDEERKQIGKNLADLWGSVGH